MWFRCFQIPYILLLFKPYYLYAANISTKQIKNDYFKYRSSNRKKFKKNKGYTNYVEDHHIIPKQWKTHKLLNNINFDINSSNNLYIMPNYNANEKFNLHPNTLIHKGGHIKYNYYVKQQLDYLYQLDKDAQQYEFWLLLNHLRSNMKNNKDGIPWK
tara:strand:+ start:9263 stop:9733 length:471 start_codon:yes stop_codon:yes gene_type:complete